MGYVSELTTSYNGGGDNENLWLITHESYTWYINEPKKPYKYVN